MWGRNRAAVSTGINTTVGKRRVAAVVVAAVVCGFGLAAVQLWPTAELKQRSQRDTAGKDHHLIQGSLPAGCWSQLVRPWDWYSLKTDRKARLNAMTAGLDAGTNQVEAHLYFGLLPLGLILVGLVIGVRQGDGVVWFWTCAGLAALSYTPGWWLPVTGSLPGFGFFQGPGRFGVVTTLAAGILAGRGLDALLKMRANRSLPVVLLLLLTSAAATWVLVAETVDVFRQLKRSSPFPLAGTAVNDFTVIGIAAVALALLFAAWVASSRQLGTQSDPPAAAKRLVIIAVLTMSVFDFWIVSRLVKESEMVADPPIGHLQESPLAKFIARQKQPLRLFAPAANFPTVFGAASTPVYLTFGPREYFDSRLQMPTDSPAAQLQWLRRAGVTHVLTETERETSHGGMTLVWQGTDPVFNRAMARGGKPLYLYELNKDPTRRGRTAWEGDGQTGTAKVTDYAANHVQIQTVSQRAGTLVLTDLLDPDWSVSVDGEPATPLRIDGMFRGVKVPSGEHTVIWSYQPKSVYRGAALSIFTVILLAAIAHITFWHSHRCRFLQLDRREDGSGTVSKSIPVSQEA
ncbi:MAG: YfhO family protein [Planctomycetes bacterium]|nr:YfhO family protein [Planctomycetota bacterium]